MTNEEIHMRANDIAYLHGGIHATALREEIKAAIREAVSQAYDEAARKLLARHDGAPEGHDVYGDAEAIRALKDSLL